jgi:hypothetical protein
VKTCTVCNKTKPLTAFPPHSGRTDGRQSYCRDCQRETTRRRRALGLTDDRPYNRARAHALQALALRHPDEFRTLLAQHLAQQRDAA